MADPGSRVERFTLWAFNPKVKRWITIWSGVPGPDAVHDMVIRQDRVRRNRHDTRFVLRRDGEPAPDPGAIR